VEAYVLYGLRVSEYAALLGVVYIWVLRTFSWSLEVYGNTTSVIQFLFEHSLRHKPVPSGHATGHAMQMFNDFHYSNL
jgi:hypothetical protein